MDSLIYPKTENRNDFWLQVKRTIHGIPVSQEQINMIVDAIKRNLSFLSHDVLLDLGCGNGALSQYFFDNVSSFHGVDLSEYLISIAKEYFENPPSFTFENSDIISYLENETNPERFTKCLCYGAFSYLSYSNAEVVLEYLSQQFKNLEVLLIGNLPDKDRAHFFYPDSINFLSLLDDNKSPIGIWRSQNDFISLAKKTGWEAKFYIMPHDYYSSHYRYDLILRRLNA